MPKFCILYEDDNNPGEPTIVDTFNCESDARTWLRDFVRKQCGPGTCEILTDYLDPAPGVPGGYISLQHALGPVCEFRIAPFKTVTEFTSDWSV